MVEGIAGVVMEAAGAAGAGVEGGVEEALAVTVLMEAVVAEAEARGRRSGGRC